LTLSVIRAAARRWLRLTSDYDFLLVFCSELGLDGIVVELWTATEPYS